jgi:Holliday junction resolvase RusA-like endonuclease
MTFVIPIPPTAQQRARYSRWSTYKTSTQTEREAELEFYLRQLAPKERLSGYLRVDMRAFVPIPDSWSKSRKKLAAEGRIRPGSRPDLDNYDKQLWDAMTRSGWWKDDSIVVEGFHAKYYSDTPRWEVTVEML